MAQNYSPKIVQDSLVMCLDASQNRSYPTTDLPVKAGLLLWLDAADDTTFSYSSGTEVSQWRDKSGNNFHANQATTAQQPSRSTVVNSRKSVNFTSGNSDFMRVNSGMVFTNSVTAIVFIKPGTQNNAYANVLDQDHSMDGYNGWVIQRNNTASQWLVWLANEANTTWLNTNAISYADNTSQIVTLRKGSSTLTLYSNGTSSGDVAVANQQIRQANYIGLNIGYWRAGAGRFYNGEICEIVVYNRSLSLTELNQVHTYLGQKWGVSNTDRSVFDLAGNDDNGLFGNGTVANMPVYDFYNKGALKFDGSADYVTTATSGIVPTSAAPYTVSVWCYRNTNNLSYRELLSQWRSVNSGNSFYFGFENSNVRFTDNWNPVTVAGAGNTNVWMNLVGVYTVSNAFIYLNGVLAATKGSGFTYTGTGPLVIGRQGELASEYFDGNIGNVLVYQKALSAAEVAQNYEAQKSKFADTIVQQGLILNLDAGNPYSYAGAGSDWFDVSGNNNTSLLVGTTLPTFSNTNGGILIYDGNTQYSRTPSPSNNFAWTPSGVGLNNMTIDLWIKTTDGSGTILSKPWSGNGEYNFGLGHQGFAIVIGNQSATLGFSSILTGNWINLMIVVSSTQYGAYINGVQNAALTNHGITNNTPTYGNGQVELTLMTLYPYGGGGNAGFSTQGNIGSFRIYNRVLTAAQVLQNYNATKGRFGL